MAGVNPNSPAAKAAMRAYAKQDYDRQVVGDSGHGSSGYEHLGPPTWGSPQEWEQFRAQYGFYPWGMQNGAMVHPPSMVGAPDWVYDKMGLRKPPVTVQP